MSQEQTTDVTSHDIIEQAQAHIALIAEKLCEAMTYRDMKMFEHWSRSGVEYIRYLLSLHPDPAPTPPAVRQQQTLFVAGEAEPHSLFADFTHRKVAGFELGDGPFTATRTWRALYEAVCKVLFKRDEARMRGLVGHFDFVTRHNVPLFATSADACRAPRRIADGLFAESDTSSNGVRDKVRALLSEFEIPHEDFKVFLT